MSGFQASWMKMNKKTFNPLHTLLLCIALFANPLHAQSPTEKALQAVQSGYHSLEQRTAKLFRCITGKGACSPADFATVLLAAALLHGALNRYVDVKYPTQETEVFFGGRRSTIKEKSAQQRFMETIDPRNWGYYATQKFYK